MLEINKIYNMDCMDGMAQFPDKYFDLIVTSPPYNLGEEHHTGNNKFKAYCSYNDDLPESEYQKWQKEFLDECYRILKDDGSMFYNHKNRIKSGKQISPYEWIFKTNMIVKQELVWFNGSQNFDKIRFYPMTERIYRLSKTTVTKFNNFINHHDVFNWQAVGVCKEHKRAFPISMVKNLLSCFPTKLKVLDPFSGSGTVAVACYDMGFDYIAFEIDKEYFDSANERIEAYKSQGRLFEEKKQEFEQITF